MERTTREVSCGEWYPPSSHPELGRRRHEQDNALLETCTHTRNIHSSHGANLACATAKWRYAVQQNAVDACQREVGLRVSCVTFHRFEDMRAHRSRIRPQPVASRASCATRRDPCFRIQVNKGMVTCMRAHLCEARGLSGGVARASLSIAVVLVEVAVWWSRLRTFVYFQSLILLK